MLNRGDDLQVTKLMPIESLITSEYQGKQYYLYLIENSFKYYKNGQSLSSVTLIDNSEKEDLFSKSINSLRVLFGQNDGMIESGKELIDTYEYLQSVSPGWKRISIHGTRRKLEDPDLVLLEQLIRYCLNHWYTGNWAYFLSQYYCCDYKQYRFKLTRNSSARIIDIVNYFIQKFPYSGIQLEKYA